MDPHLKVVHGYQGQGGYAVKYNTGPEYLHATRLVPTRLGSRQGAAQGVKNAGFDAAFACAAVMTLP